MENRGKKYIRSSIKESKEKNAVQYCWFQKPYHHPIPVELERLIYSYLPVDALASIFLMCKRTKSIIEQFLAQTKNIKIFRSGIWPRHTKLGMMLALRFCQSLQYLTMDVDIETKNLEHWLKRMISNNSHRLRKIDTGSWNILLTRAVFTELCKCLFLEELNCEDVSEAQNEEHAHIAWYNLHLSKITSQIFPHMKCLILPESTMAKNTSVLLSQPFPLETLRMGYVGTQEITCLNLAHFQDLQELHLSIAQEEDEDKDALFASGYVKTMETLTQVLNSALFQLTTLKITLPNYGISLSHLTWNMPQLTSLTVNACYGTIVSFPQMSAKRLRTVHFDYCDPLIFPAIVKMLHEAYHLTEITLHFWDGMLDQDLLLLSQDLQNNHWPQLTLLYLNGFNRPELDAVIRDSCPQLRHLTYALPHCDFPALLCNHPHLERVRVIESQIQPQKDVDIPNCTATNMTHLAIPFMLPSKINFPALHSLLIFGESHRSLPKPVVSMLLIRNQCPNLVSLKLNDVELQCEELGDWSLCDLDIQHTNIFNPESFYSMVKPLRLDFFWCYHLENISPEISQSFFDTVLSGCWKDLTSLRVPEQIVFSQIDQIIDILKACPSLSLLRLKQSCSGLSDYCVAYRILEWCDQHKHVRCSLNCDVKYR